MLLEQCFICIFAAHFRGKVKIDKVNTQSYKTKTVSAKGIKRNWLIVDAEDQILGRIASQIAKVLQGKHKASYTPNIDTGDHVIVVNADKIKLTGNKLTEKKYLSYSGYPGGQKSKTAEQMLNKKPEFIIENAVRGMLPKTRLGRVMFKKLHVYVGAEHPHEAQKPQEFNI